MASTRNNNTSSSSLSMGQMRHVLSVMAIVAVVFSAAVLAPTLASARYLPTRANNDQVRRQEIKEILRLLLDLPTEDQHESAWSGSNANAALVRPMIIPEGQMYELAPQAAAAAVRSGAVAKRSL